jgi:hypothetical protein
MCTAVDEAICLGTPPLEFPITVTGNNPQQSSFSLSDGESQAVTLGPGTFRVTETLSGVPPILSIVIPTFTGDCKQTSPDSFDATGTISAGQILHCTITNILL